MRAPVSATSTSLAPSASAIRPPFRVALDHALAVAVSSMSSRAAVGLERFAGWRW
jgi:hypothetical protein